MTRRDAVENRRLILKSLADQIADPDSPLPTMSDIVSSSGLGRGTVYRNFADIGELYFAYLQDGYTEICCTYEPEWIDGDPNIIRDKFRSFLLDYFEFNLRNQKLLKSRECITSDGIRLAKTELRRKIYVTATRLSSTALKPIELTKWADVIAHCVETEHLMSFSKLEAIPDLSVSIAFSLLDEYLNRTS